MQNDDLMLIVPTAEYADSILSYKREMLSADSSMDGCGPLRRHDDIQSFLQEVYDFMDLDKIADNYVSDTTYICVRKSDCVVVGFCQIRHFLNLYLYKYSGHIGYSVRPSERRKGYAKWMLSEALRICASKGMTRAMVSCLEHNEASRKTILTNGGEYIETVFYDAEEGNLEKYWVPTGLEKPFFPELENRQRVISLSLMARGAEPVLKDVYSLDLKAEGVISSDVVVQLKEGSDLALYAAVLSENGFIILAENPEEILLGYGYVDGKSSDVSFEVHLRH